MLFEKKQLKRQQISFQDSFFLSSYDIFHYVMSMLIVFGFWFLLSSIVFW